MNGRYYLDPGTQDATLHCLKVISGDAYVLLAGARASGKSTRLIWLRQKLEAMGYWVLYISFDCLAYWGSREVFWESFGDAINPAVVRYGRRLPSTPISSTAKFMSYFRQDPEWKCRSPLR